MEWSVLDWNEPSIQFYLSLGAKPMDEWTVYRLTVPEIQKLAEREVKEPQPLPRSPSGNE